MAQYGTSEETAAALAGWASERQLRYERYGMLPTASEHLEPGDSPASSAARVASRLAAPAPAPR